MRKTYSVLFAAFALGFCLNGSAGKVEAVATELSTKQSGATVVFKRENIVPNVVGGIVEVVEPTKLALNGKVRITGWAADVQNSTPTKSIVILSDGKQVLFLPQMGIERKDVAEFHNSYKLTRSGWDGLLNAVALGKGIHRLEIYAVFNNDTFAPVYCRDKGISLEIEVGD